MLAAEYERSSILSGFPPATINVHRWDPLVAFRLQQLGFFGLLDLPRQPPQVPDNIVLIPMVSGDKAALGPATHAIKALFERIGGHRPLRIRLSSAIADAIENVVGHAYPTDLRSRGLYVPRWWLLGAVDITTSRISFIIYDQGITIPASLPRIWPIDEIISTFKKLFNSQFSHNAGNDGKTIHAAMQIGETSTSLAHRGLGLDKIRSLIQHCDNGQLRIVSRYGECIYRSDGTHTILNHDVELPGTYVELQASFASEERSRD